MIDLGIDQPEENFVSAVRENHPQVLALSGFLPVAFDSMKSTIEQVEAAALETTLRSSSAGARWTTPCVATPGPMPTGTTPWPPWPSPKRWWGWRRALAMRCRPSPTHRRRETHAPKEWARLTPEEKSDRRWAAFLEPGLDFAHEEAAALYRERAARLKKTILLEGSPTECRCVLSPDTIPQPGRVSPHMT